MSAAALSSEFRIKEVLIYLCMARIMLIEFTFITLKRISGIR